MANILLKTSESREIHNHEQRKERRKETWGIAIETWFERAIKR